MRLDEAIEEILDAMVEAVSIETQGGSLDGVATVVRGDRARPMPPLPAVWIVPQPAAFTQEEYGEAEGWMMSVSISALVKDDDPEAGSRECVRLTALARRAVLADRTLGLTDTVIDTLSERFDAAARTNERNRNLAWAEATVRVHFTVSEQDEEPEPSLSGFSSGFSGGFG